MTSEVSRRSSRVPITLPVLVTSLEPSIHFSEVCETLTVSAHGCAMRSLMRLEPGIPVHFHTKEGRQTMAHIIDCQPIGPNTQGWRLGVRLDQPDNFWGLNPCPEDWTRLRERPAASQQQLVPNTGTTRLTQTQTAVRRTTGDNGEQQLSSDRLQTMVSQLLQPLLAEVTEIRHKLAQREANPSRFEISLSQIPPELEEKLWVRLRHDLAQRALQLTREESDRVLVAAQGTIERKISKTQEELQQRVAEELKAMEQRTQALADGIAETIQAQFHAGLEQFHHQALGAETRLKRQSEEVLGALQQRLDQEYRTQRHEMQQVQEAISADSSRLQAQITDVGSRLASLNESARRLESDFAARMSAIASDIVSGARVQLESTVDVLLKELRTRNAQQLGTQLDEACGRLHRVKSELEASLSESLQTRVAQSMQSFDQTIDDLARNSVSRWRLALAGDLNSIVKMLGQQLRMDSLSVSSESEQPPAE